jgi:putative DNA primase/helicase
MSTASFDRLPLELIESPQWVCWKFEPGQDGKITKVLYVPVVNGRARHAKSSDPSTWGSFEDALSAFLSNGFDGVGFVPSDLNEFTAIDLDHCRNPETGEMEAWAMEIILALNSYWEISPSGTGVHIWVRGKVLGGPRRANVEGLPGRKVEVFPRLQFVTVTGNRGENASATVEPHEAELKAFHAKFFPPRPNKNGSGNGKPRPMSAINPDDQTLIAKIRQSKQGPKFDRLWAGDISDYDGDDSSADFALCNILRFWCSGNASWMDSLFRQSGLMRSKWDSRRRDTTYGAITIENALSDATEFYDWAKSTNGNRDNYHVNGSAGPEPTTESEPNSEPAGSEPDEAYLEWLSNQPLGPEPDGIPRDLLKIPFTDSGNAERILVLYGVEIRHCYQRKRFMVFDAGRWTDDCKRRISNLAKKTARMVFAAAADLPDETEEEQTFKRTVEQFARKSESARGRRDAVDCLSAEQGNIQVSEIELDSDPLLLNVLNGTIDLKTGALREHRKRDLISKLIPIEYPRTAERTMFDAFLDMIMEGNKEMIRCLQIYFGCAATGNPEKVLFIFHGTGNNGKTTLIELVRAALGNNEYAGQVAIESLMASQKEAAGNNAINSDLADLRGKRFVSSSETEQGQRLSLGRIKYLTGLGEIKARRLGQDWITFQPTHKLFIDANHKPVISDPTDAVWNRVRCIPFSFEIKNIDTNFLKKLKGEVPGFKSELPGILRWLVEGAQMYLKEGLISPPKVLEATQAYREESDRLKPFLEERCYVDLKDPKCWVPANRLWGAYNSWCETNGEKYPIPKTVFDERLEKIGCKRGRKREGDGGRSDPQVRSWIGIRFRTENDKDTDGLV